MAPKEECKDFQQFEVFFQDVIDKGGEGIILRDPRALYHPGRASGYLKHKVGYPLFFGHVAKRDIPCEFLEI